jgi:hypothetical protein
MNTELLKSLIPVALLILLAAIILGLKPVIAPKLSEFDKEFEDLKSRINICNSYYELIKFKSEIKILSAKYKGFDDKGIDKLLNRLDQKIINNRPVTCSVSRR